MKDIYENWNLYKEEIELLQELENIFLEYSDEDMLNEGIMAKIVEKVNDYFLKLGMKVMDLAQKVKAKAFSLLRGAANIIARFAEKYPTLAKFTFTFLAVLAASALMYGLGDGTAAADAIVNGQALTQEELDAFEGMMQHLNKTKGHRGMQLVDWRGMNIGEMIDAAADLKTYLNNDNVDKQYVMKTLDKIEGQTSALIDLLRNYKEGTPEEQKFLQKLVKMGQNVSYFSSGGSRGAIGMD